MQALFCKWVDKLLHYHCLVRCNQQHARLRIKRWWVESQAAPFIVVDKTILQYIFLKTNRRWSFIIFYSLNSLVSGKFSKVYRRCPIDISLDEPPHDKTNKISVRPAKTQISLGIRPVWSESSLCAQWVAKDPSFLHADSKDSDQTGRILRLIWVFAGRTATLLIFHVAAQILTFRWKVM